LKRKLEETKGRGINIYIRKLTMAKGYPREKQEISRGKKTKKLKDIYIYI
jgi:hypothetical protein